MRLSRPCYDKPRRCPGWAGGGTRPADATRCHDGTIRYPSDARLVWKWLPGRCGECGVVVAPFHTRLVDPSFWLWPARRRHKRIRKDLEEGGW